MTDYSNYITASYGVAISLMTLLLIVVLVKYFAVKAKGDKKLAR